MKLSLIYTLTEAAEYIGIQYEQLIMMVEEMEIVIYCKKKKSVRSNFFGVQYITLPDIERIMKRLKKE